ncbi:MAG: aldose 1-epimerase family protein [Lactobacillales bacterium]|nr:aldose 1-epimerase family protein [Lactobacillales bacterium]
MILENNELKVTINSFGGELASVVDKADGTEYIWQADPAFWGRHTPTLFPVVGKIKDGYFDYAGARYEMTSHGFFRDGETSLELTGENQVTATLVANEFTKKMYPFDFVAKVVFTLVGRTVKVGYVVENPGSKDFPFSIGGHPAFNVPLEKGLAFEDYYFDFGEEQDVSHIPLDLKDGGTSDLKNAQDVRLNAKLPISHKVFQYDAMIFATQGAQEIALKSDKGSKEVVVSYGADLNLVGLWSPYPKEAPFVCVEPWYGLASDTDGNHDLFDKKAIQILSPGKVWNGGFEMEFK